MSIQSNPVSYETLLTDSITSIANKEYLPSVHYHTFSPKKGISFSFCDLPHQIFTYFPKEKKLRQTIQKIEKIKKICEEYQLNLILFPDISELKISTSLKDYSVLKFTLEEDQEIKTQPNQYQGLRFSDRYPFYEKRASEAIHQMSILVLEKGYKGKFDLVGSPGSTGPVKCVLLNPSAYSPIKSTEDLEDKLDSFCRSLNREHLNEVYHKALQVLSNQPFLTNRGSTLHKIFDELKKSCLVDEEYNQNLASFYKEHAMESSSQLVSLNTEEMLEESFFKDWMYPKIFGQRDTLKDPALRKMYFIYCARLLINRFNQAIKKNHLKWGELGVRSFAAFKNLRRIRIKISDINFYYKQDCYFEGNRNQNLLNNVIDKLKEKGIIFDKLARERLPGEYLSVQL